MSKEDDYFKPLTESETEIHNELGTGNISMSVYDLNTLFTSFIWKTSFQRLTLLIMA